MVQIHFHRKPYVYHAHHHFWYWLSCTIGKGKKTKRIISSCFFQAYYWFTHHRLYSCHHIKQKGYSYVLWSSRYHLIIGSECKCKTTITVHENIVLCSGAIDAAYFTKRMAQSSCIDRTKRLP